MKNVTVTVAQIIAGASVTDAGYQKILGTALPESFVVSVEDESVTDVEVAEAEVVETAEEAAPAEETAAGESEAGSAE